MIIPHRKERVSNGRIVVSQLGSGWAAVHLVDVTVIATGDKYTDVQRTGIGRYRTRDEAVREALHWSETDEIPTEGIGRVGSKLNPGKFDCHAKALPDEPMFTLLARDPDAPNIIDHWIAARAISHGPDDPKIAEAAQCAAAMREWRTTENLKRVRKGKNDEQTR